MADYINHRIEVLATDHDVAAFDCGEAWLNSYIRKHAARNAALGYGRSYVAVPGDSRLVDGFYTLSMSCVGFEHLPDTLARQVPRYPMPVVHLGCLAVDIRMKGQGLGDILLVSALERVVAAADVVAARALDVKAISDRARQWYIARGFLPFTDHRDHLFLPMDTIRATLAHH